MSFNRLFRASLYVTLFLSTVVLSIDGSYATFFPVAVAATSFLAFLTVDRDSTRGMPRDIANSLAIIAAIVGLLEWYNATDQLLQAIGHTLVYMQIIYSFSQKTVEIDWYLFLIGLVVAVIGVFISVSDSVGVLAILWVLSSLWTFALFFLRRESLRDGPPVGVKVSPTPDPANPYPGLLSAAFFFSLLRIAAVTFVLGGIIFLLMPRWPVHGMNRFGHAPSAKHMTGFGQDIKLGQLGEILENDDLVMSVEFTDSSNAIVTPDPEVLLRGLTMTTYEKETWTRGEATIRPIEQLETGAAPILPNMKLIRQRFKLEDTGGDALFAVRPVYRVQPTVQNEIVMSTSDGTLYRHDQRADALQQAMSRPNKFDYSIISAADEHLPQPLELVPNAIELDGLLQVPENLRKPLRDIADVQIAKLRPEIRNSHREMARALERFLRDGDFTYTLKMDQVDDAIDPVLDFLTNRREGHCAYFASALTLLCRSLGIPARMVNGFKGGDWNDLGHVLHVRQKHAHSWVEVLVGRTGSSPIWITLDPTPSRQRAQTVAQLHNSMPQVRYFMDYLRSRWTFYVAGFDMDRQESTIYGPSRTFFQSLAEQAMRGFRLMGQMLKDLASLFYFENVNDFFRVRGFFVSVIAMLLMVGLYKLGRWLIRRLFGRGWNEQDADAAIDPGLAFYQRLVRILATLGIERPAAETPREFAKRAASMLETRPGATSFGSLPGEVVDLFYAKRFGAQEPDPIQLQTLNHSLASLEVSLASPQSGA